MSMSGMQANFFAPTAMSAATARATQTSTQGGAGSASTTNGLTATTTGTTFLNLLVKELQNQDPSAPMDSTAMVGQMISLNQLDQLIGINQVLSKASSAGTSTSPKGVGSLPSASSAQLVAQQAELLNHTSSSPAATAGAALNDPNSILDFSAMNIPYGGK